MANGLSERIRAIGPYVVLVLLVPGGIVLAILLYLRSRKARPGRSDFAYASNNGGGA